MTNNSLLVLDDDQVYLRVIKRAMTSLGYHVTTCSSIAEAQDALLKTLPNFAIIDLHLGPENGTEFVKYLGEYSPNTKSVILSGYANVRNAVSSIKSGASECLPKPMDAEEIDKILRRLAGEQTENPKSWESPDDIRVKHIVSYWEKNGRNVSETARKLDMHRRTLQRILRRAQADRGEEVTDKKLTPFQRLRRRYVSQKQSLTT